MPLAMIVLTHEAWFGTLFYGTPCGSHYDPSKPAMVLIVLLGYLGLPLLVSAHAIRAVREADTH